MRGAPSSKTSNCQGLDFIEQPLFCKGQRQEQSYFRCQGIGAIGCLQFNASFDRTLIVSVKIAFHDVFSFQSESVNDFYVLSFVETLC